MGARHRRFCFDCRRDCRSRLQLQLCGKSWFRHCIADAEDTSQHTGNNAKMVYNTAYGRFLRVKWTLGAGGGTNTAFVFSVVCTAKA